MSSYATVAAVSSNTNSTAPETTSGNPSQSSTAKQSHDLSERTAALAKPVSHYERKTRQIHQAMQDIWSGRYSFQQTAEYYGYTPEELGVALAVFGTQTMEIVQQRNVVRPQCCAAR